MTEGARMTVDRFEWLAARFGASPAAWPPAERAAGETLLTRSAAARRIAGLHEALADDLDAAGASLRTVAPAPPADLIERVLVDAAEAMPDRPRVANLVRKPHRLRLFGRWGFLRPVAAFAVSAAIGVWIGYSAPPAIADAAGIMIDEDGETAALSDIEDEEFDSAFLAFGLEED